MGSFTQNPLWEDRLEALNSVATRLKRKFGITTDQINAGIRGNIKVSSTTTKSLLEGRTNPATFYAPVAASVLRCVIDKGDQDTAHMRSVYEFAFKGIGEKPDNPFLGPRWPPPIESIRDIYPNWMPPSPEDIEANLKPLDGLYLFGRWAVEPEQSENPMLIGVAQWTHNGDDPYLTYSHEMPYPTMLSGKSDTGSLNTNIGLILKFQQHLFLMGSEPASAAPMLIALARYEAPLIHHKTPLAGYVLRRHEDPDYRRLFIRKTLYKRIDTLPLSVKDRNDITNDAVSKYAGRCSEEDFNKIFEDESLSKKLELDTVKV